MQANLHLFYREYYNFKNYFTDRVIHHSNLHVIREETKSTGDDLVTPHPLTPSPNC